MSKWDGLTGTDLRRELDSLRTALASAEERAGKAEAAKDALGQKYQKMVKQLETERGERRLKWAARADAKAQARASTEKREQWANLKARCLKAEALTDAQTVTLERMREALNRLVLTEKRRHSCPDCAQGPGQAHLRSCPIGRALLLADEDALSAPVSAGEALLRAARRLASARIAEPHANQDAELEYAGEQFDAAYRAELAERGGK